jgi:D-xylose transport system ATP-binding protein
VSFDVRAGEVLGIGGLMGAGRTELLMHLFGAWGVRLAGEVNLCGKNLDAASPVEALAGGLALVSEDRKRYGLVLERDIGFNLSLSSITRMRRGFLVDEETEVRSNQKFFSSLRVKAPSLETAVGTLSGGNQQKVVIGKALMTEPHVVFLDEPTRGIDVGAKIEVYELVNQLTAEGKAVVLVSSELPELMGMSDRILMLHDGEVGGLFAKNEATQETLLHAAMGRSEMTNAQ